ncbi:MAG TPA: Gfo/Idh/MocA family oxidoreductase [Bryobacteraceae bacterium]|nr:Gfo/Idh/MocA family oxidoreductase [Bryobacteraceae bacterium]
MSLRVALSGYGAVAAIHARYLREHGGIQPTAVYGPNPEKARAFAAAHGFTRVAESLADALREADAILICSPSPEHFAQAAQALDAGVSALVELPACRTRAEALMLGEKAARKGVIVECAHTSRYLEPYRRLKEWLDAGALGTIEQIAYWRHLEPRSRSWVDDALLHHAEHPLDLWRYWFGALVPLACAAHPMVEGAQNIALAARLPHGAPVAFSISYTARLPKLQMNLIASRHTIETDGFSYIRSDSPELCAEWNGQQTYEHAVRDQDAAFLARCLGHEGGVPWEQTVALAGLVDRFRDLAGPATS